MNELPKRGNPGDELRWEWLNELRDAVESALNVAVDPDSGLEMVQTPGGKSFRLNARGPSKLFLTTSSVTPRSGTALGSGTGTRQFIKPDGTYDTTGVDEPLLSAIEKTIRSGALVKADLTDGRWVIDVVYSCTDLS